MFVKSLLIGVCSAITLLGCVDTREGGHGSDHGASGPTTMALSPGCHETARKCVVVVSVDSDKACGFSFNPDVLKVAPRFQRFVIVWRLPPQFEFRDGLAVGDGVKFAKEPPNGEFEDGYATDDIEGGPPSVGIISKRRFRWVFVNSVAPRTYHYLVQFHRVEGDAPIICDPAISNVGA